MSQRDGKRHGVNSRLREALTPSPPRSPSPARGGRDGSRRERSRSPYRGHSHGDSRQRDDHSHHGANRSQGRYRDHPSSYMDYDRPRGHSPDRRRDQNHQGSNSESRRRYDGRDGGRDHRGSRLSDDRATRGREHGGRDQRHERNYSGDSSRRTGHSGEVSARFREESSKQLQSPRDEHFNKTEQSRSTTKSTGEFKEKTENTSSFQPPKVDVTMQDQEDAPPALSEEEIIEKRRQAREALKAKLRGTAASGSFGDNLDTPSPNEWSAVSTPGLNTSQDDLSPATLTMSPAPPAVIARDDLELGNPTHDALYNANPNEISAADYNDYEDTTNARARQSLAENDATLPQLPADDLVESRVRKSSVADGQTQRPTKKPKTEDDMFASEDEAEDEVEDEKVAAVEPQKSIKQQAEGRVLDENLIDDWDDAQGYYRFQLREILHHRYIVQEGIGRGVYSSVVRAVDNRSNQLVAIKIVRQNEWMKGESAKEVKNLQKVAEQDPENQLHIIRILDLFRHKGHPCLVFENLADNLREVLSKFRTGLPWDAVRQYSRQMLFGLVLLRKCNLIHADIKPDNMLINEGRGILKISDLGSAHDVDESDMNQVELVSRFYRAPDVILGMPHTFGIDTWSVGCTIFEIATGNICLAGADNTKMLQKMADTIGPFSLKLLNKGEFKTSHFEAPDGSNASIVFRSYEKDKIDGVVRLKRIPQPKQPKNDLKSRIRASFGKGPISPENQREIDDLDDFLRHMLALYPDRRFTPEQALKHRFLRTPEPNKAAQGAKAAQ